jgi:hypothetical protein
MTVCSSCAGMTTEKRIRPAAALAALVAGWTIGAPSGSWWRPIRP